MYKNHTINKNKEEDVRWFPVSQDPDRTSPWSVENEPDVSIVRLVASEALTIRTWRLLVATNLKELVLLTKGNHQSEAKDLKMVSDEENESYTRGDEKSSIAFNRHNLAH